MYVVLCKIDHCIHIHWCIVMGLGHNDPWVELHMWPKQTWGQRSYRGQWPLVQVFGISVFTYFDVFSNLILQWLQKHVLVKAGKTHGSRTALFKLVPNCVTCTSKITSDSNVSFITRVGFIQSGRSYTFLESWWNKDSKHAIFVLVFRVTKEIYRV